MLLHAALVPPPGALDAVRAVVAGIEPAPVRPTDSGPPGPPGRHRMSRRRQQEAAAPTAPTASTAPTGPMLDLLPTTAMYLPITKFGNVSLTDASRLADAMAREATSWETPRLHLAGGLALEPVGDDSVWVKLAGDLDALGEVARGVPRVAQRLQLFVDRRRFRPHVQIAKINSRTTAPYLEELLAALDEFESTSWWQTTFSLVMPAETRPDRLPFKTYRDITLGPAVSH